MTDNKPFDEPALLVRLQKDDADAFEQLYFYYSKAFYGTIFRFVKSADTTEEILQELFQRLWEKRATVDPSKPVGPYLYTIAKHLIYDFFHARAKQREATNQLIATNPASYTPIDDEVARKETSEIIQRGIQRLPPQRRLVYTLCKVEGKSYRDVSHVLGISTATISDHIVKATKSLRAYYHAIQASVLLFALNQLF